MKKINFVFLLSVFGIALAAFGQGGSCGVGAEPRQPIDGIISFRSGAGSAQPVGFHAFANPASPKRYRTRAWSGTVLYVAYGGPDYISNQMCEGAFYANKSEYSGAEKINDNGDIYQAALKKSYDSGDAPLDLNNLPLVASENLAKYESYPGLAYIIPDGWNYGWFQDPGFEPGGAVQAPTLTFVQKTFSGDCGNGNAKNAYTIWGSHKRTGSVELTLSDEDDEGKVTTRAKTQADTNLSGAGFIAVPPSTRPYAYETSVAVGGSTISVSRVEYQASFTVDCPGEYEIHMTYAQKPHGAVEPVTTKTVIESRHLESGTQMVDGQIKVENKDTDYTIIGITVQRPSCGGDPTPGSNQMGLRSIHAEFSLGRTLSGASAGQLLLETETVSAATYTPATLVSAAPFNSGVTIIRDAGNVLRQVKAPQAFADIVTLDASSYEVRFYAPADVRAQDNTTKIYALSGTPFVIYKFENPDAALSLTNRLRITETRGSNVRVSEYAYDSASTTWSLSKGNGLRKESLAITTSGADTTKTTTIRDENNIVVSKSAKTYRTFPWGEELISEVLDPDNAALTTSYDFYTNSSTDGSNYKRLKLRTNADGSWERFTYDFSYRTLKSIRPYLNAVSSAAENLCRVTENVYTTLPDADGDTKVEQLTTTVESTLGVETGRTYRVDWSKQVTLGTDVCNRRTDIRCVTSGAAWDASANLVSETLVFTVDPYIGRTRRTINPDGTATLISYSVDANNQQTTIAKSGQPNATLDDIAAGTRTTTFTSAQGQVTGESVTDIASTLSLSAWTATQFDALGRPTRMDYTDGTYATRDYACCGLASTRDRSGLVTTYTYNDLGQQTDATSNGLTNHTTYDADGRVKTVSRIGSDTSTMPQASYVYDLAGRLVSSSQPSALNAQLSVTTTTNEVFDSLTGETTRTTTTPSGTSIDVRARDGSSLSTTGTAVAPRSFEYGSESGELFTKQILLGTNAATTEWSKSYTDFAGRSYKTVLADNATTQSYFNAIGQLVRQVDADGITTLFAYNAEGQQEIIALDVNANGLIDFNGSDRITKTTSEIATKTVVSTPYTVQRSTTQIWETDAQDTATTVSLSEQSADGLRSWQTVRGPSGLNLTTSSATVLDGNGGRTITTTGPDGVKSIQVYSGGLLTSSSQLSALDSQLAAVAYAYDPHHRLSSTSQLSALNTQLVTTYSYYADDQIQSVTTPDPDTSRSGGGYDPQTTTYAYDSVGRLSQTTQPDGGVVTITYYPTGQQKKISGARTYPEERTYDAQGRLKTLKTWKDFASDAGAAVTTWNYNPQRGWLDNKRYADNQGPSYTYTSAGRLLTRTWARGIVTTYGYSPAGDLTGIDYSDATSDVTIQFDRTGRPKNITDGAGTRTLSYDVSGQLQDEDYTAGPLNSLGVHRTYDSLNRLDSLSASSAFNSVSFGYDAASRLDIVTSGTNTVQYGYLANSPLVQNVTFKQSGTTRLTATKVYDNLNRLSSVSNSSSFPPLTSVQYQYNSANQRTKLTREDNAYWNYGYDSLGQVTSAVKKQANSDPILGHDFAYTFDDIGNRKTATANSQIAIYTANALNQYSSQTVPGIVDVSGAAASSATVTVTVDAGTPQPAARQGELFYRQLTFDNSTAPQFPTIKITGVKNNVGINGEDAVTEVTKSPFIARTPESFTHDADGNLTSDAKWIYNFDGENRLKSVETSATAVATGVPKQKLEFGYDDQSRRITKKVSNWNGSDWSLVSSTLFIYDGWNLIAELNALNANAVVRTYVWGLDLSGSMQGAGGVGGLLFANLGSTTHAPAFDGNGNVIALTAMANGLRSATYEYSAFGETIQSDGVASVANPFRFSSKYSDDETGLLYYGYRFYNPSTGRWLSRDPIEERGGVNLYGMIGNDPVNRWDFLGMFFPGDPMNPNTALAEVAAFESQAVMQQAAREGAQMLAREAAAAAAASATTERTDKKKCEECTFIWLGFDRGGRKDGSSPHTIYVNSITRSFGWPSGNLEVIAPDGDHAGYDGGGPAPRAVSVFEAKTGKGWVDGPREWWSGNERMNEWFEDDAAQFAQQARVAIKCKLKYTIYLQHPKAYRGYVRHLPLFAPYMVFKN